VREPKFFRRYDYDRSRLPNAHLAALDDVASLDEARTKSGASIGYPGWGLLYYVLLSAIDPESETHLIETGTNFGASTIVLAQALQDSGATGRLQTFEIDPDAHQRAQQNLEAAGLDHLVTQHLGDAKQLLAPVVAELPSIRVAFLDGSHLVEDVIQEFRAIEPKLEPNAVVMFDNTYRIASDDEDQRVHGALALLTAEFGGNLINFPSVSWYTPGMALWQRQPFDTAWNQAVDDAGH